LKAGIAAFPDPLRIVVVDAVAVIVLAVADFNGRQDLSLARPPVAGDAGLNPLMALTDAFCRGRTAVTGAGLTADALETAVRRRRRSSPEDIADDIDGVAGVELAVAIGIAAHDGRRRSSRQQAYDSDYSRSKLRGSE
jgi:hypothetical protein